METLERFIKFVNERQAITDKRAQGLPKPWTKDLILQQYRFCNVRREDDKVTRWIAHNWRKEEPDNWFAMVVARHINEPNTLDHLGYPVPWDKKNFYNMIKQRQEMGLKIYNAAYMIVPRQTKKPKPDYLVKDIFGPMWEQRATVRPRKEDSLQDFYNRLYKFWGMGTFMSAQIIADCKYTLPLLRARDWDTFACSGPGSRRGMNRIMGRRTRQGIVEATWYKELFALWKKTEGKIPQIHMQDLQNCLCEWDKYERVRTGEGTPKQKYNGGKA